LVSCFSFECLKFPSHYCCGSFSMISHHGKKFITRKKVSNANCLCQINNVQHPSNKIPVSTTFPCSSSSFPSLFLLNSMSLISNSDSAELTLQVRRRSDTTNSLMIMTTNRRTTLWALRGFHRHTTLSNRKWVAILTVIPMPSPGTATAV